MKITLLHPSRGRAKKARETYEYWMSQASGKIKIEHILSLDFSDKTNEDYGMIGEGSDAEYKTFGENSKVIIDHNESVVEATNQAAKLATGDILIYLSDDFKCPKDWDTEIINYVMYKGSSKLLFTDNGTDGYMWLLKVDDCLQKFDVPVLTIPIMSIGLFKKLGYFWHPGYRSMFVDEDLYWTCKNNNWLIEAPKLKFPHEHCSIGKAENDETYTRSAANWDSGKAFYEQRKASNFPL